MLVDPAKCLEAGALGGKTQPHPASTVDQPCRHVHQLLYHGLEATAFGRMPYRGELAEQADLPD